MTQTRVSKTIEENALSGAKTEPTWLHGAAPIIILFLAFALLFSGVFLNREKQIEVMTARASVGLEQTVAPASVGTSYAIGPLSSLVKRMRPEAAVILTGTGTGLFLLAMVMRIRSRSGAGQVGRNSPAAGRHIRIPAYEPQMATGTNGAAALKAAIGVEPGRASATGDIAQIAPSSIGLQDGAAAQKRRRRFRQPPEVLFSALRVGTDWSKDIKLSRRAEARLDADPLMQRLTAMRA